MVASAMAARAEVIELRLDYLAPAELEIVLRDLPATFAANSSHDFILTLRPREQGGQRELTLSERLEFWRRADALAPGCYYDWELDLVEATTRNELNQERDNLSPDWRRIICSHHDFAGVPTDLANLYERLTRTPAAILKIAVNAHNINDCLPVFHLLERAQSEGRRLIAIAMGEAGATTRILGTAYGSYLTYGALTPQGASAPGQITAADLRDLYHLDVLTPETFVTGLIGSPVAHSISPHMHNAALAACAQDGVYLPFLVDDLDSFMRRMVQPRTREINWRLRGLSVTAPHKRAVIKYLDEIDLSARAIGAVNTVVVRDGKLFGHNTDAAAAVAPLRELFDLRGARVAVIGAGGAARAVLWQLAREGAQAIVFVRDAQRAAETAQQSGSACRPLQSADFGDYDIVINTTPLGTHGPREAMTPATAAQLRGARIVYDLVYNPIETLFMREGRSAGCLTLGGLPMLVVQAAEQFRIWTDHPAPLDVMRLAAVKQMSGVRC